MNGYPLLLEKEEENDKNYAENEEKGRNAEEDKPPKATLAQFN
jgi:hypothetical protein